MPHLDEDAIKQLFVKELNCFCGEKDEIVSVFEEIKREAFWTKELDAERKRLQEEMNVVAELIQ